MAEFERKKVNRKQGLRQKEKDVKHYKTVVK